MEYEKPLLDEIRVKKVKYKNYIPNKVYLSNNKQKNKSIITKINN